MNNPLTQIQVRNFRTQKKIDVDLSPTVTTIVGESADGKSTIIQALKWAALNMPDGIEMINWDSNKAIVRVLTEKKKVIRIRSKSINKYKLNKKSFTAFGRGNVPASIAKVLNLSLLNFQGQFERHFWFCESPPEVSRQLNSIIDLSSIDTTLSNLASELKSTRSRINLIQERREEAAASQTSLKHVVQMDKDLNRIERLSKDLAAITQKRSLLHDLSERAVNARSSRRIALDQASVAANAMSAGNEYRDLTQQVWNLTNLIDLIEENEQEASVVIPSITPLKKLKNRWLVAETSTLQLEQMIEEIEDQQEGVEKCIAELRKCKRRYARATEGKCPICQKPMKS